MITVKLLVELGYLSIRNDRIFIRFSYRGWDSFKVRMKSLNIELPLVCFYRFHTVSMQLFWDELEMILNSLNWVNSVLLGDFNLDILSNSYFSESYMSLPSEHGFYVGISSATRLVSDSCLDQIIIRMTYIIIFT